MQHGREAIHCFGIAVLQLQLQLADLLRSVAGNDLPAINRHLYRRALSPHGANSTMDVRGEDRVQLYRPLEQGRGRCATQPFHLRCLGLDRPFPLATLEQLCMAATQLQRLNAIPTG
jgi:hypothetical protein